MTEEQDLLIPFSLAKRYLASKNLRVAPEASEKMRQYVKEMALKFAEKVTVITVEKKRATIYLQDVVDALKNSQ
mgnify:FL=1